MKRLEEYPEIIKAYEALCESRRDQILAEWLISNGRYKGLCKERANTSMKLNDYLSKSNSTELLEAYADAVHAQEVFELDNLYKQALHDAFEVISRVLTQNGA